MIAGCNCWNISGTACRRARWLRLDCRFLDPTSRTRWRTASGLVGAHAPWVRGLAGSARWRGRGIGQLRDKLPRRRDGRGWAVSMTRAAILRSLSLIVLKSAVACGLHRDRGVQGIQMIAKPTVTISNVGDLFA